MGRVSDHYLSKKLFRKTYGPAHGILVLIALAQMPRMNVHVDIYSWARGLNLHLHLYFDHASSECCSEYAHTVKPV